MDTNSKSALRNTKLNNEEDIVRLAEDSIKNFNKNYLTLSNNLNELNNEFSEQMAMILVATAFVLIGLSVTGALIGIVLGFALASLSAVYIFKYHFYSL